MQVSIISPLLHILLCFQWQTSVSPSVDDSLCMQVDLSYWSYDTKATNQMIIITEIHDDYTKYGFEGNLAHYQFFLYKISVVHCFL